MIDRSGVETRLRKRYTDSVPDEDPGWYAMCNVVLASGCRITTCIWTEAQSTAKEHFDSALSVEANFLHGDLHLQPTSTSVSYEQLEKRNWISWTLYYFEKHRAMRAGRPSVSFTRLQSLTGSLCLPVIDDDDISCALPTWALNANSGFVECFKKIVD